MPTSEKHQAIFMPTFGAKSDANQIASDSIFIAKPDAILDEYLVKAATGVAILSLQFLISQEQNHKP